MRPGVSLERIEFKTEDRFGDSVIGSVRVHLSDGNSSPELKNVEE